VAGRGAAIANRNLGLTCLHRSDAFLHRIHSFAYAVISFGGFLGMGEDYYPMPWASLKYDIDLGGLLRIS
jgi:hypothetical protein